jgi:hypothetical protein
VRVCTPPFRCQSIRIVALLSAKEFYSKIGKRGRMAFRRRKQTSEAAFSSQETILNEVDGSRNDVEQAPAVVQSSSFRSAQIEYKFDIASRLDESVAVKLVNAPNRSPDLIPLTKSFDAMRKQLRQLISSAKQYHKSMIALDVDRLQVREVFHSHDIDHRNCKFS